MVCDRCIIAVERLLLNHGYYASKIELGKSHY